MAARGPRDRPARCAIDRRLALTILGLPDDASDDAIDRAWRDSAKANHPDRYPADPLALVRMTAINLARTALRAPARLVPAPEQPADERSGSSLDALVEGPMPRSARIRGLRPQVRVTIEHPVIPSFKRAA